MTLTTEVPTRTELTTRVAELVPLLRKHSAWQEENRRLHEESIEALTAAGAYRLRVPARYGGYESDMATVVDVLAEIGRGDGSTSWVSSIWSISTWLAGLFPDEVQDEVFGVPDARVCGILSPGGMAVPAEGGWRLNGKWAWNTGSLHSQWNVLAAVAPGPGDQPMPVMAVVPMSKLGIIDDWHTAGLRGTGSVSTVADDLFVPEGWLLPMPPLLNQQYASKINSQSPAFRQPLVPMGSACVNGTVLGMAKAAQETLFERIPHKKITYTDYEQQDQAPITHRKVAEVAMAVSEAEFHSYKAAQMLDTKAAAAEEWSMQERALVRLHSSMACRRSKDAVDVVTSASGASSMYTDMPAQRIQRDINVVNVHALMNPDTNLELYGRVASGLEPNTVYM